MSRVYKLVIDDETSYDDIVTLEEDEYTEELLRQINCLNENYTRLDKDMDKIYNLLNVMVDFFFASPSDNLDDTIDDDLDNSKILF